jgi:hypothetical protein
LALVRAYFSWERFFLTDFLIIEKYYYSDYLSDSIRNHTHTHTYIHTTRIRTLHKTQQKK